MAKNLSGWKKTCLIVFLMLFDVIIKAQKGSKII